MVLMVTILMGIVNGDSTGCDNDSTGGGCKGG